MSMWCTGLLSFLMNPLTDWLNIKPKNNIEIIPSREAKTTNINGYPIVSSSGNGPLNNKRIVYEPGVLRRMLENLQHDQRLRLLPFGSIDKIRRLKLKNKPIRNKIHLRLQQHQNKANSKNLIDIKKTGFKIDSRIIFATCNIQSMWYKKLQVSHLISDYSLYGAHQGLA